MFDSQKLSFENFLLGWKHGCYVFVKDNCSWCEKYKKEIEYIDSCFLFFVEVTTVKEMAILEKLTGRSAYPQTVGYFDNEIKFARTGVEFELQQAEVILPFLKQFPDKPLSEAEIQKRIEKHKNRCLLTYYVFGSDVDEATRQKLILAGAALNEFAIDISKVGIGLPNDERERLLESQYHTCRMVVYKNKEQLDAFEQRIVMGYAAVNQEITFEVRSIDDRDNSDKGTD